MWVLLVAHHLRDEELTIDVQDLELEGWNFGLYALLSRFPSLLNLGHLQIFPNLELQPLIFSSSPRT